MTQWVYAFSEGNRDQKDLLGGKGANLAEMTRMGFPVPPGFIVSTEACRTYLKEGHAPTELATQVTEAIAQLEQQVGRVLGDHADPLLVSVRSGAKYSMPGMMETVLDIGLNDHSVLGLAKQSGNERFAYDSYRRLIQMFGKTVLDINGDLFEDALSDAKHQRGVVQDVELPAEDMRNLVDRYKEIIKEHSGKDFPQDPRVQLDDTIEAVFRSWNSERAQIYRRQERIPSDLGTAVNICTMVFGNVSDDSGTGVAFTRDPATGARGVYGDYLQNAQGEDVVAGIRNTEPLSALEKIDKACYDELIDIMAKLEEHYQDLCDIEFTVERGKLWMLQTRVGKRTAQAAFRIATQLVDEGLISEAEALQRVNGHQLAHLMFPRFDDTVATTLLATGMNASPGAAVGKVVFDSDDAVAMAERGEKVILVRRETNPDDLNGMIAAEGILTSRGGKTSHAAVVARGMGKTCVCGAESLDIDTKHKKLVCPDGTVLNEGDVISIDGTSGKVFAGVVPVVPSSVVNYFEGQISPENGGELIQAVDRIMKIADRSARMTIRTNADAGPDAARARRYGAQGIGLCRTEHMFLGDRRVLVEKLILAANDEERSAVLDELLPLQRQDFVEIFEAMDGLPVTIRLLDPPLHEFLPDITELSVKVALSERDGKPAAELKLLEAVQRLHEQNPMLGLRGVRLGLVTRGLFEMQARAVLEAAAQCISNGNSAIPEIMIPLVGAVQELEGIKEGILAVAADVERAAGAKIPHTIGTMIEVPRAALTAGQIAGAAEFFSFGTNDLTQTAWAFSRDDVEAEFFGEYLERGIFRVSPFESLDTEGVGRLVRIAAEEGRAQRPDLKLGVCGEHGGDPASIHFFNEVGLDYVSCSPFRVPVARLEAGRAAAGSNDPSASA